MLRKKYDANDNDMITGMVNTQDLYAVVSIILIKEHNYNETTTVYSEHTGFVCRSNIVVVEEHNTNHTVSAYGFVCSSSIITILTRKMELQ